MSKLIKNSQKGKEREGRGGGEGRGGRKEGRKGKERKEKKKKGSNERDRHMPATTRQQACTHLEPKGMPTAALHCTGLGCLLVPF